MESLNGFFRHLIPYFGGTPDYPLYHYTTGENLIQIVTSGELWATHIACLNDAKEVLFAVEALHERVRTRRREVQGSELEQLYKVLDQALASPNVEVSSTFVASFSELADDLSQWRAYAGGCGGHAICFDPKALRELSFPSNIRLLRVLYDPVQQAAVLDDILKWCERWYCEWEGGKLAPDKEEWAQEFCAFLLWNLSFLAPCFKSASFASEREWRLVYDICPTDPPRMKFRSKPLMITRHLPLALSGKLPIISVLIGPSSYPALSKVAVSDLLNAAGYDVSKVGVGLSTIPYRS